MKINLIIASGLITLSAFAGKDNDLLKKKISPDNPYLKMSRRALARAMHMADEKKKKGEAFWLTWGYVAVESKLKGNAKLKKRALFFTNATLEKLAAKPTGYWSLIPALKTVDFWIDSKEISLEQIKSWLKKLRPSVQSCYDSQNKSSWLRVAPNTLHQAAAGLEVAAAVYERIYPKDPDLKKWRKLAIKCNEEAEKQQLPGGAFSYIRSSGPDPCYFNFDSNFLGIYYLHSGNEQVKQSLIKMSGWSKSATICGWLTAFSSPWWKHIWGTGGPYFAPEIIAALSKDPLTRGVMNVRLQTSQPYYFTYYAMHFYDDSVKPKAISDRCEFDENANGGAMRRGGYDVVMPFRSWCDSTCGASFSDTKKVISYINSISIIPKLSKKAELTKAYSIVHLDKDAKRTTVTGKDWIAQAVRFQPVKAVFGGLPKGERPWKRTDIWFADKDGFAGVIELTCLKDTPCEGISLLVRVSKTFAGSGLQVSDDNFIIKADGDVSSFKNFKNRKWNFFEAKFNGTSKRKYKKGETFRIKVAVSRKGSPLLNVKSLSESKGIYSVSIEKEGSEAAVLVFNSATGKLTNTSKK